MEQVKNTFDVVIECFEKGKVFKTKKHKIALSVDLLQMQDYLTSYVSPYQMDLYRKDIQKDTLDIARMCAEICKKQSEYNSLFNKLDIIDYGNVEFKNHSKEVFINYAKTLLKMPPM
jgi:hypothetical protein